MRFAFSILFGAMTAIASTLIHQSIPPLGVIVAIVVSYCAIWWLGRYFGKRRYKFAGLIGWFVIIAKAGSFGAGHELLIQGDAQGSALLMLGFLAGLIAVAQRA